MEQIAKLLFTATAVSIFCYVIVFAVVDVAGNGGEYWGFDGRESPRIAAVKSFDSGDFRFLSIDLTGQMGQRVREVPYANQCDGHPYGPDNLARPNVIQSKHGQDSIRLATKFARNFNQRMAMLLGHEQYIRCE